MGQIAHTGKVDEYLKTVTSLDSISAQILLREAYEITYRIYNHDDPSQTKTQGLELVQHHAKEDYVNYGPLHATVAKFYKDKVFESFGLSLTEFLALPREYTQMIFGFIAEDRRLEQEAIETAKRTQALKDAEARRNG